MKDNGKKGGVFLGTQDVYNLICGRYQFETFVVDVRSHDDFILSSITVSINFSIKSECSPTTSSIVLFDKIMSFLKEKKVGYCNKTPSESSYYIFVGDDTTVKYFDLINQSFTSNKFVNVFFMEQPFKEFENEYHYLCNTDVYNPDSLPCEILPNLLLGPTPPWSKEKAENYFRDLKITHVLNVAANECVYPVPENISYLSFKLLDLPHVELPFDQAVQFIDNAIGSGNTNKLNEKTTSSSSCSFSPRVLVHCLAGMSRSASVVLAYMLYKYRFTLLQCVQIVKAKRDYIDPNDGFVRQLRGYEARLGVALDVHKQTKDLSHPAFDILNFTKIPISNKISFLLE